MGFSFLITLEKTYQYFLHFFHTNNFLKKYIYFNDYMRPKSI